MSALDYLKAVEERAREMYGISDQGLWEELHPSLQARWINAASEALKEERGTEAWMDLGT